MNSQKDIFHYKASDRYQKGVSDILASVGGVFVAIELKGAKGKPTPHQKLFIKDVCRSGGVGGIAYTLHDVKCLVHAARHR